MIPQRESLLAAGSRVPGTQRPRPRGEQCEVRGDAELDQARPPPEPAYGGQSERTPRVADQDTASRAKTSSDASVRERFRPTPVI